MARLPDPALVVLVGPSGSGKSTGPRRSTAATRSSPPTPCAASSAAVPTTSTPPRTPSRCSSGSSRPGTGRGLGGRSWTPSALDEDRRRAWLARPARSGSRPWWCTWTRPTPSAAAATGSGTAGPRARPAPASCGRAPRRRSPLPRPRGGTVGCVAPGAAPTRHRAAREHAGPVPNGRGTGGRRIVAGARGRAPGVPVPVGRGPAGVADRRRAGRRRGGLRRARRDGPPDPDPPGRPGLVPDPEPWVTLGAGRGSAPTSRSARWSPRSRSGRPGITAKAAATLDVLTGGRAFVGVGAGWFEREHAGVRPRRSRPPRERLDDLERGIETMRALWAPGTKAYDGTGWPCPRRPATHDRVPATCPSSSVARERARCGSRPTLGDAANVPSAATGARRARRGPAPRRTGRRRGSRCWTCPPSGHDRDDAWARVERLRGRASRGRDVRRADPRRHRRRAAGPLGRARRPGVDTVFLGGRRPRGARGRAGPLDSLGEPGRGGEVQLTSARCSTGPGPGGR